MFLWASLLQGEKYGDIVSTALRGVAEMGKTLDLEGSQASRFFAVIDGGGDR